MEDELIKTWNFTHLSTDTLTNSVRVRERKKVEELGEDSVCVCVLSCIFFSYQIILISVFIYS